MHNHLNLSCQLHYDDHSTGLFLVFMCLFSASGIVSVGWYDIGIDLLSPGWAFLSLRCIGTLTRLALLPSVIAAGIRVAIIMEATVIT